MNVLCIGAGVEQCYSIIKAQELGLNVIALDKNEDARGLAIANKGIVQDIKEMDKVIGIANQYNIKATIPTPIGRYLTVVGAVNDALGLKGISFNAATNCTDKVLCTNILQNNNIACAKQVICKNKKEIKIAIEKIGVPCILKPRFGSGSKGVITIFDQTDISININKHIHTKGDDDTIVEKFIDGSEYGIDGIVKDGEMYIVLIREKILTLLPYRQEVGYFSPANLSKELICSIKDLLKNSCKALGIDNCAINADIIMNLNQRPYLIEIAGRPAGYSMSSFFIPKATGIDFIRECVNLSIGKKITYVENIKNQILVYKLLNLKEGYIRKIPKDEDFDDINIVDYKINLKEGDYIGLVKEGRDILRRGFIAVTGDSVQSALANIEKLMAKFIIKDI
ncbi:ATP-grasp domain-containing protein [Clostridiaceae bacterium M8S5]|nr:ATP-grasp domain-containing protein [Clostridiaceae bacterium M8S5]